MRISLMVLKSNKKLEVKHPYGNGLMASLIIKLKMIIRSNTKTRSCPHLSRFCYMSRSDNSDTKLVFRVAAAPCVQQQSLHGQPYPPAPDYLLELQQVHSQRGLQLLAGTLRSPPICAVQRKTQCRKHKEKAGEQGQVQVVLGGVIHCETQSPKTSKRSDDWKITMNNQKKAD